MSTRFLAVIDTETTGLDPTRHRVVQHGLVLLEAETLDVVDHRVANVEISLGDKLDASPEAMMVHGLDVQTVVLGLRGPAAWEPLRFMYSEGIDWDTTVPAFWPVEFDRPFIAHEYRIAGAEMPFPRRCIDVRSICYWALFRRLGAWSTPGLQGFMDETTYWSSSDLEVPDPSIRPHNALYDAFLTASALRRAMHVPTC